MQSNRKYHKNHLYYPDDKDLADFLESSKASASKLRNFLLRRGIYLSKGAPPSECYKYISRLPLAWNDLTEIIDVVEISERKENTTFTDYDFGGELDTVHEAFSSLGNTRGSKHKENYNVTVQNDKVVVTVDYIETDLSKTPMLQGRPASLTITIEKIGNNIRATHTSNERTEKILTAFHGTLETIASPSEGEPAKINSSIISLEDILDPSLRVKFFKTLTRSMADFQHRVTTNVKVARMPKFLDKVVVEQDAKETENATSVEEDEKIKNVIINGMDIESTPQYQGFLDMGFFISNISWDAIHQKSGDKVAFSAGYAKPETATGLEYKIHYRQRRDSDGYMEKERVPHLTQEEYRQALQNAAVESLASIRQEISTQNIDPLPGESS